ncbi:unnamed protein product [Rhizoctonia solani]|uniref:Uncharacterized protein n=1 Tax=Rhizoctonia solani TaxID=456999 RepID=A0A8H3BWL5_9AGAM|nr:unnamed protein product [Rhizoctonia solani]
MFKSLSSRSTRSVSVSSSGTITSASSLTTPTSASFLAPTLPPIPPTPNRDIPSICVVAATPGTPSSPIIEKRRTRTLVPKRSVIGKENGPHGESSRVGSLGRVRPKQTPSIPEQPPDPQTQVADLVARQFVASQNDRQCHTMGPSSGFSFVPAPRNPSPPTRQTSYRIKPSKSTKRVLVENRKESSGGQVEAIKETISKSTRPISRIGSEVLDSLRGGTLTRGTSRAAKVGSTRVSTDASVREGSTDENAGTAYVVKKRKSRGTLDSIRWALGDRTNAARKAEKEKEKAEKALEKGRRSQDSSGSERPRVKLTIDTRAPPVDTSHSATDTPSTSVLSPVAETPITTAESATDSEAITSGTEKTKWKWTIGRKRTKSPGPSLSPTSERPGHGRTMSLDVDALLATTNSGDPGGELGTYARRRHRTASLNLPTLMQNAEAEAQAEDCSSPLPLPPQPTPVEIAPVDFGQEPKTTPKTSTGSAETQTSSGTMRRSSIANMIHGDSASNTGSLALRAMRSVRSIASIARLGGWGKGDDSDKSKEKEGTLKDKKRRKSRKMPIFDEDEATNTSGESWEVGALGRDPTMTATARIGQPIMPNLQLSDPRTDLGMGRPSGGDDQEDRDWVAGDREGSGSASRVAPSTISFGKTPQPRMSNESSGSSEYPASSTHETASITSSKPRRSSGIDYDSLFSIDSSEADAGSGTMKGRTQRKQDSSRPPPKSLMGLFEVPAVPAPAPAPDSPPHLEVRGVKVGKGRVRERVREFEARAEEHSSVANLSYGSMRSVSSRQFGSIAPTIGLAPVEEVDKQQDTFFQDREHALSLGRSASVPLHVESPHRPTKTRPKSEHLLRRVSQEDAASISMINAANSDLSDLINRLDLSATPDSKYQLSPPVCRAPPAFVQDSPCKRSPRNPENQQSLTALVGYNHSPVERTSSVEDLDVEIKRVLYKGKTSRASVFTFSPDSTELKPASNSTPGHQHPGTQASPDLEQDTPRERASQASAKARRRTGTYGLRIEDSIHISEEDRRHSDIPEELQAILTSQSESESSPVLSSSSSLPLEPRVTRQNSKVQFQVSDEYLSAQTDNEEVTFDFTGELGQLKGGSRNSFVEVLVSAFKTPALPSVGDGQLQLNLESPIRPLRAGEGSNQETTHSSGGRTPTFAQISTTAAEHSASDSHLDRHAEVFGKLPAARVSGAFDYDTLMRELDEVSSAIEGSTQAQERANRRRLNRLSTDSDRSSLFRGDRGHRRDEPTMSFSFAAPPVSFHNRPYGRQIAHSLENDNTGRLSLTGELPGRDSDDSERFARPGLGDKMFQMGTEHGLPLPSIMASPANSDGSAEQRAAYEDYTSGGFSYAPDRRSSFVSDRRNSYAPSLVDQQRMSFMSYDSHLDVPGNGNTRRSSVDADSLFERRGRPSSISSVSVFGDNGRRRRRSRAMFNPSYRPVSIISMQSETTGEDDTMVSMIGGADNARVPRKSIATNLLLDASPCMRAEKRAKELARAQHIEANRAASLSALTGTPAGLTPSQPRSSGDSIFEYSPSKGRSCLPSRPFARPRPPGASKSIVDDSDDEEFDLSGRTPMPSMFNRRMSPAVGNTTISSARRRSSGLICTAEPPDTPPLSDEESVAGVSHVGDRSRLSISAQVPPSTGRRARTRAQDQRRRQSYGSRSSVNLSISEDDLPRGASAFVSRAHSNADSSASESVVVINPDAQMAEMIEMISAGYVFSNEQLEAVTRYCALRNEAVETVTRSQKIWQDTDFSRFTLSTFEPPTNSSDIKAMIDHSQATYNEIPVEVYRRPRNRHSRNYPRASPYHVSRHSFKSTMSPHTRLATESVEHALALLPPMYDLTSRSPRPVPESPYGSLTGMGLLSPGPGARAIPTAAPLSPLVVNVQPVTSIEEKSSKPGLRPRAGSDARSALGWGRKPSASSINGKAPATQAVVPTAAKENEAAGTMSNTNHNLRFNRPRPKGRVASGNARPSTLRV